MVHQRTGTRLPTTAEQLVIQRALDLPTHPFDKSIREPAVDRKNKTPWLPTKTSQELDDLASSLVARLATVADEKYDTIRWKLDPQTPRLSLNDLHGAEKAAVFAVDMVFSDWLGNAFLTNKQQQERQERKFTGNGSAIVDASDTTAREKVGHPVDPWDMATYFAANDEITRDMMAKATLDPYRGPLDAEEYFRKRVLEALLQKHDKKLSDCDRLGYYSTKPRLGKVVVDLAVRLEGSETLEDAIMQRQYSVFQKLIHEYIHTLEHPVIPEASKGSLAFREGVCEWLTCHVIGELTRHSADVLHHITTLVEGKSWPVEKTTGFVSNTSVLMKRATALRKYLSQYQPASDYARYVQGVEQVVATIGGSNGLLAAYFQGHVEYLGLSQAGLWDTGTRLRPFGLRSWPQPSMDEHSTVAELAADTGIPVDDLVKDNPEFKKDGHRGDGPPQIFVSGFHGHRPVLYSDEGTTSAEGWGLIAAQHGVGEAALRKVNGRNGQATAPEWWILVPDHD